MPYGRTCGPPSKGAGVVVHEKVVAQWRPYTGRCPQALDPRVAALSGHTHKMQHHLVATREVQAGQ